MVLRRSTRRCWTITLGVVCSSCAPVVPRRVASPAAPAQQSVPAPSPARDEPALAFVPVPAAAPPLAAAPAPTVVARLPVAHLDARGVLDSPAVFGAGAHVTRVLMDGALYWIGPAEVLRDDFGTGVRETTPRALPVGFPTQVRTDRYTNGLLVRRGAGELAVLDLQTLRTRFRAALEGRYDVVSAVHGSGVLVVSLRHAEFRNGVYQWKVLAFDAQTGATRWERTFEGCSYASEAEVRAMGDALYLLAPMPGCNSQRQLSRIDPATGAARWTFPEAGFLLGPSLAAGMLFVGLESREIVVLEPETGRLARRIPVSVHSWGGPVPAAAPDGSAVFYAESAHLVAVDPRTGVERWRTPRVSSVVWIEVDRDAVFVMHGAGELEALDPASGASLWMWGTNPTADVPRPMATTSRDGAPVLVLEQDRNAQLFTRGPSPAPARSVVVEGRVRRRGPRGQGQALRTRGAGLAINGTRVTLDPSGRFRARLQVRGALVIAAAGDWQEESFTSRTLALDGRARYQLALESWTEEPC